MVRRARWAAFVAVALVLSACQPNRFVSGWIPYWQASAGRASIGNGDAASLYSEVSLMWFGTAADGSVPLLASSSSLATTVATARASGLPVIPTIFDSSAPGVMKKVLSTSAGRSAHADAILARVRDGGYDGIDIDYEVFAFGDHMPKYDATYSTNWVNFVKTLAAKLHANGKLLSVTVPPVWNSGLNGYTFYAQDKIAPYVDRLRLMVYDWSVGSPGPISPNFWQTSTINYTTNIAKVPAKKVQLGLPAYGRHWNVQLRSTETCPDGALVKTDSITLRETAALAALHHVTPSRDSSGELFFTWNESKTGPTTLPPPYIPVTGSIDSIERAVDRAGLARAVRLGTERIVTCTIRHVVFVPDATSIRLGADRAVAAGWSGVVIWAIGYETADVYQALGGVAPQRSTGAPTATAESATFIPDAVGGAGRLRVLGRAWDPEFDLPVPVRIEVTKGTTFVTRSTVLANASRPTAFTGGLAGLGPFHGVDTTIPVNAGAAGYTVCITELGWGGAGQSAPACVTST